MTDIHTGIQKTCQQPPPELSRRTDNERHFIIEDSRDLLNLCKWAEEQDYYLCNLTATDERSLEDGVFKLYYVLSSPQRQFVILEYPLNDPKYPTQYTSIRAAFPAVEPLEKELFDLFGLSPHNYTLNDARGFVLHTHYPTNGSDLYPLRRTNSLKKLACLFKERNKREPLPPKKLPEGMLILPVGPIHAGVIESGHFPFHIAGEVVEELPLRLGYKHKGIEKLFETKYTLENGWQLAEKVSGDSSFAHSMAYCQAVESLAGVEPSKPAQYWRGLFLELERIYNHVADFGALVHDMAFDLVASEIAVLREEAVQLNERLIGSRLLRGVNFPGGVELEPIPDLEDALYTVSRLTGRFFELSKLVLEMPTCRERALTTGILTWKEVKSQGATGLVARASMPQASDFGEEERKEIEFKQMLKEKRLEHLCLKDFRLRCPQGVYGDDVVQEAIRKTVIPDEEDPHRSVPVFHSNLKGDVFARIALRAAEVETSVQIIKHFIQKLNSFGPEQPAREPIANALRRVSNYEFSLGCVEGWRGDIFYWLMKGPNNMIFRCKVRDPSLYNWHAFPLAVIRKPKNGNEKEYWENILADFPLDNKSCNLSYSGHDL